MNRFFLIFSRFLLIAFLMANFVSCKEELPWEVTPYEPKEKGGSEDDKPQSVTLRPLFEKYGIKVKNQGSRGTCSIFALVAMIEFERAHVLLETKTLSEEYLNWASHMMNNRTADGSFFDVALNGLNRYGICEEIYWPYASTFNPLVQPSQAAKDNAASRKSGKQVWIKAWDVNTGLTSKQLDEIKKQLDNEHPVAIGFRWPNDGKTILPGGELTVVPETEVHDGHSILMVGYQNDEKKAGGGYFIFKNSWGESFGDKGYGRVPYGYAMLFANDVVWLNLK